MRRPRPARALAAVLSAACLASGLVSCGGDDGRPPRVPMPSNVPTVPQFPDAGALVGALERAGVPCLVTLHSSLPGGSSTDCTTTVDGDTFEYVVDVYNPEQFTRDDIGNAIAAGRTAYHQTFVAAGNWSINVVDPTYAPRIAQILGGAVLPGDGPSAPARPLPVIPTSPRYDSVAQLAAALDASVGCEDRKTEPGGSLACRTGSRVGHGPNCASLRVFGSDAGRDRSLRGALSGPGIPGYLAAGANWSVNLCDYGLADRVARDLGGVVVSYDGG
ncbi:hypothetical protein [Kitasatospora griseola]|uniref:hypothetical protein n=1 Tax=Kitasatospora griseola TaxID=2064 RepID=UPI001670EAB2|nr:hypothetical protein [Kitasatospora griseola]GGQ60795.1 hypothetical protein GCM10010195_15750 [Kitasatospora griseola]